MEVQPVNILHKMSPIKVYVFRVKLVDDKSFLWHQACGLLAEKATEHGADVVHYGVDANLDEMLADHESK